MTFAQEVRFPFDGSADPGAIYVKYGQLEPEFLSGRSGEALRFRGSAVVAMPMAIDARDHPQLTFSAWLNPRADAALQAWLFGPGDGRNQPYVRVVNRRVGVEGRRADGSAIPLSSGELPIDAWTHVAVVWDYTARTIEMHVGELTDRFDGLQMDVDSTDVTRQRLYVPPGAPQGTAQMPFVFIGARNFVGFGYPAVGIAIDDVQIIGAALSRTEIAARRDTAQAMEAGPATAPVAGVPSATAPESADADPETGDTAAGFEACASHSACDVASYCALDGTCHPLAHRPMDPYVTCSAAEDCGAASTCLDIELRDTTGSLCTHVCRSDGDCPSANGFSGACHALAAGESTCYQRCNTHADCGLGTICETVSLPAGTIDGVCVPVGA